MKKSESMKKKKLLKHVKKSNIMKRHRNFIVKTKHIDIMPLNTNQMEEAEIEAFEKETKKEIAKVSGLNPKDVR